MIESAYRSGCETQDATMSIYTAAALAGRGHADEWKAIIYRNKAYIIDDNGDPARTN